MLLLKLIFQIILIESGYRWLSADDFSRTVISYEWMKEPKIYSGVWLSPHFWLNGFFMFFIKDIMIAAGLVSVIFSAISLYYFYKVVEISFNKQTAIISSVIFCVFPFQAWLSMSGLPESTYFCFIIAGIYYFILWYRDNLTKNLVLSAVMFALSNGFRYEGWLFSFTLIVLTLLISFFPRRKSVYEEFPSEDLTARRFNFKIITRNLLISCISLITIIWWILQNYFDNGDALFFMKETAKIYDQFNNAGFLQKLVQYPTFIFYIAPLTTVFSFKVIYENIKSKELSLEKLFVLFNLVQLLFLMAQGLVGTGGTNMISRYIVINAILLIPLAVKQALEFRKLFTSIALGSFIIVNVIWCFYFPQPYREDTFEVGYLLKSQIENKSIAENEKVFFEEDPGYLDIWAIKSLSNSPDKIVQGIFPISKQQEKSKKKKGKLTDEELNILEIKNYLEKNNISTAIVRSDGYTDKLRKLSLKNEQIGDYQIFYLKEHTSNLNDSTVSSFAKKINSPENNSELLNFGQVIGLSNFAIDNTNFGLNPQTVTLEWTATNEGLLDSIDFENFEFDRYKSLIKIINPDTDSSVYTISSKIFSERNIENLVEDNYIKNIIVLKPFALLMYSRKQGKSPFEGGMYNLELSVLDSKTKNEMLIYRGTAPYKRERTVLKDTIINQGGNLEVKTDTGKVSQKFAITNIDSVNYTFPLASIIAMFPDSDYNKIAAKKSEFVRITLTHSLQYIFSQRYQADHVLNWVFTYF